MSTQSSEGLCDETPRVPHIWRLVPYPYLAFEGERGSGRAA